MSLSKDNIWKLLAPLVVMGVMLLIPVPDGMPPQAWHYFAVFVAMIVGMLLEPIPATAISFIAVTICVIGSNYLLFDASELADPAFNASKQALKWGACRFLQHHGLAGFRRVYFRAGLRSDRAGAPHCAVSGKIHG